MKQNPAWDHQVGFLALPPMGPRAHAIYEGFDFALTTDSGTELVKATFEQKWE